MNDRFLVGTHAFHPDPNFNYQMNRWMAFGRIPQEKIAQAASRIRSLADWNREFRAMALEAEAQGDLLREACCLRAVEFFLPATDPDKLALYDRLTGLLRRIHADRFASGALRELRVPYEGIMLPVWHAVPPSDVPIRGTILMTGGFDCYKEELVPVFLSFAEQGYRFYYFEGPGQGEVLNRQHHAMTHAWEKPVRAVLDALELEDVTLVGLSLGGYLAPRAARGEGRIRRVIAWGTMHDFYDVVSTRRGWATALFIRTAVALRLAPVLNGLLALKMRRDAYTAWGVRHGMHVMGQRTPYAYFRALRHYSMKRIASGVKQDFLLMTGSRDHFVEYRMFERMMRVLTGVRSLTGRVFTELEQAENHCQFRNLPLAIRTMTGWIESMGAAAD